MFWFCLSEYIISVAALSKRLAKKGLCLFTAKNAQHFIMILICLYNYLVFIFDEAVKCIFAVSKQSADDARTQAPVDLLRIELQKRPAECSNRQKRINLIFL